MNRLAQFTSVSADELTKVEGGLVQFVGPSSFAYMLVKALYSHSLMDGVRAGLGE